MTKVELIAWPSAGRPRPTGLWSATRRTACPATTASGSSQDLADALQIAASAADDHSELISLRARSTVWPSRPTRPSMRWTRRTGPATGTSSPTWPAMSYPPRGCTGWTAGWPQATSHRRRCDHVMAKRRPRPAPAARPLRAAPPKARRLRLLHLADGCPRTHKPQRK